ncbi:MAG: SHOCT domain-containing protein [Candidatus Cloacimonadota bacterium]|nr:SHOCT domain-containing protein [Candidatus Cloacimonadota bacterium]
MSSEIPLSGGDRIKIVAFFLVLAGTIFFGVIPVLIALAGIYIMKKDKSFSPVINSKKYIKAYLVVLALGAVAIASIAFYQENDTSTNYEEYYKAKKANPNDYISIYSFEEHNPKVKVQTAMVAGVGLVLTPIAVSLLMSLFGFLYFRPLEEHQEWIVNNGIFFDFKEDEDDSTGIMGRDKLSSFSVADELIKWNDLLEKELISQEEFDKAKQKLLNQK